MRLTTDTIVKTHGKQAVEACCSWEDLRLRFLALLDTREEPCSWTTVWKLFVTHGCYLGELDRRSRWVLWATKTSFDWLDDVKQEAMIVLATRLKRRIDLNLDARRAEKRFAAWVRSAITHHCFEATRTLRRHDLHRVPLSEATPSTFAWQHVEERLDLVSATQALLEPERSIVALRAAGHAIDEIAAILQLSPRTTYRAYDRGLFVLRDHLQQ